MTWQELCPQGFINFEEPICDRNKIVQNTWGYHARMSGVDLALIMHKLNHESIANIQRYLGITDDELEVVAQRLNL